MADDNNENGESFGRSWLTKAKEQAADEGAKRSMDALRAQRLANSARVIAASLAPESRPGALKADTPETWAYWLAEEATARLGLNAEARLATIFEILHTFMVLAEDPETRPPLRMHSTARWPKARPLPPDWTKTLYITHDELRAWAAEHYPGLLEGPMLAEPPATAPQADAVTPKGNIGKVTGHKLQTKRHALDAIIGKAKSIAIDGDDYLSVWAAIVQMADSTKPPAPLKGVNTNGAIRYQTDKGEADFTKAALQKKMKRAAG